MSFFSLRHSEHAARILGYAGLIPFIGLTLSAWVLTAVGTGAGLSVFPAAIAAYGAVILSFLGAVHWGRIISAPMEDPLASLWLLASVIPSLIGWVALLLPHPYGLGLLLTGFALAWDGDRRAARNGLLPQWYGRLRTRLSLIVGTTLVLALFLPHT
ncbi:DUF3429 domain-containing protein [Novispirillum itersonii]|uniref:DUF3429 domain-containing protein n=1 Tax=Novispirillum itersonii TaxID=189 RepID=UPI000370CE07|nr:DUF3429 domain-containing protein [Novispirillum itersonii]